MKSAPLVCHPSTPCEAVRGIGASLGWMPGGRLVLKYSVEGEISRLHLPDPVLPARRDGLWRHTCFEAFLLAEGSSVYDEFNFAPSGEWACYQFAAYRAAMASPEVARPPKIRLVSTTRCLELEARIDPDPAAHRWRLGLAAVLEQQDGSLSYWALAHPPGKPDFHHAAGFALSLARPSP